MPASNDKSNFWVGVDLGGTKIRAGVYSTALELRRVAKASTKAERGTPAVIERMARAVCDAVDECDLSLKQIQGVGVGTPGTVEPKDGVVTFAPILGWQDVPLRKLLEKELDLPVVVANGGGLATMGVYEIEFDSKPETLLGIFVGAGISGGLIVNGKLYQGANQTAGAIGHMVIEVGGPKCTCGTRGCLEALASRTAIFQNIHTAIEEGRKTVLTDMLGEDLKNLRCDDLRQAIRRGDKVAQNAVETAARHLGIAVGNLVNLCNPQMIVLGGGTMATLADEMLPIIEETARAKAMPGAINNVKITVSHLGDTAGIIGAARHAQRALK